MGMRTLPAAGAAAVAVFALAVGCARGPQAAPAAGHPARPVEAVSRSVGATPSPARQSIFSELFGNPSLTFTGGDLYLTAQQYPPRVTLSRVDPATGVITASNTFSAGVVSAPLAAGGWLWVTDDPASVGDLLLLRLDPRTLMVTGELNIGSNPPGGAGTGGHIAFAAGWLWVDGPGELVQVSPRTVTARQAIPLPGADSADIAASPDGSTLVVSEADSGAGSIQRRDPVTGALLASHPMLGVVAPLIGGGVSEAGVWVREPTGMLGYIERFQTATMTPQAGTQVEGSNGISADVWDGVLWVRNEAAGGAQDYCADPATGRRLAALPLPDPARDYVLVVHARTLYYSAPAGGGFAIRTVPVPAACG